MEDALERRRQQGKRQRERQRLGQVLKNKRRLESRRRLVTEAKRVVGQPERQAEWKRRKGRRERESSRQIRAASSEAKQLGSVASGLSGDLRDFEKLCAGGVSLQKCGCLLAWLVIRGEEWGAFAFSGEADSIGIVLSQWGAGGSAVHRACRKALFPIQLGQLDKLPKAMAEAGYEVVVSSSFSSIWREESWISFPCSTSIGCMDIVASPEGAGVSPTRQPFWMCVPLCRGRCGRISDFVAKPRGRGKRVISSRFISYSGEEVPIEWNPSAVIKSLPRFHR